MQRRQLLLGGASVAAAAIAGCLGSAQETDPEPPTGGPSRAIIVSKSGRAESEPDLAIIEVGVQSTGDTAAEVRDALAERSAALRDALLDYGIDEDHITTSRFHIRERIDHGRMREDGVEPHTREEAEEYLYYEGTHSFTVDVHDVDAAGEVVDTAVDAGADTIGRIQFTLSEERRDELREIALGEAIDDARSEAEFVAEQIDETIVDVTVVDTSGGRVTPVHEDVAFEAADDAAPPTEFEPGDVTVSAQVDIRFEME